MVIALALKVAAYATSAIWPCMIATKLRVSARLTRRRLAITANSVGHVERWLGSIADNANVGRLLHTKED